ncbi:hypothetical protein B0A52_02020 [Exophiala mesophila]|uniref:Uncharacterized protein n=1 Tax=Exophiala mesophila TaxID=212818 RepID=A0A438NEN5_EXOME|nr:hypothetical protein B0A52_02020 [Exophiala mesophila]
MASGLAGSFAGIAFGAFVPQVKGIQGAIIVGSLSVLGQVGLNAYDNMRRKRQSTTPDQQRQQQGKSWNPFKSLTDEEYHDILQSKLLRIKAEISIVDDQIADLNRAKAQQDTKV